MNTVSKFILGFVVIAVFACLWFLLSQRKGGSASFGCGGNCSGCGMKCSDRKNEQKENPNR